MNMNKKNVWTTGLLVLTLSACSSDSTRSTSTDTGTSNTGSNISGSGSAVSGSSGSTASSGTSSAASPSSPDMTNSSNNSGTSGTSGMAGTGSTAATPQISYGTVQAIDPMTRQDVGVGAVGAAAAGGSMGSPTDKVYRVTVKMDDGSSQMVVLDSMPSYKTGDRVRYSNGTLTQY